MPECSQTDTPLDAKPRDYGHLRQFAWKKGESPNPGGRPKKKSPRELDAAWRRLVAIGRRVRLRDRLEVLDAAIALWRHEMVEGPVRERMKAASDACEALGLRVNPAQQHQHTHTLSPETEARIAARLAAELSTPPPPALLLAAVTGEGMGHPASASQAGPQESMLLPPGPLPTPPPSASTLTSTARKSRQPKRNQALVPA